MPEQTFEDIDAGSGFDWGRTSSDYDRYRPGPPDSFYQKLCSFDIGLAEQDLLDIGTGTGLLPRRFAQQGVNVTGIDVSEDQIQVARAAAHRHDLSIDFQVCSAEKTRFDNHAFDAITANQCWLYLDKTRAVPEICRLLKPNGKLAVSYFNFAPHLDPIVRATEELVLKYNPAWTGGGWDGTIDAQPDWNSPFLVLVGFFVYDEQIPFTRESWRGRIRALRGMAAALPPDRVNTFDLEHDKVLMALAGDEFKIWHRVFAHIFRLSENAEPG